MLFFSYLYFPRDIQIFSSPLQASTCPQRWNNFSHRSVKIYYVPGEWARYGPRCVTLIYLNLLLSIYLSIYLIKNLSKSVSFYFILFISIYLSIYLSVPIYQSLFLRPFLSINLYFPKYSTYLSYLFLFCSVITRELNDRSSLAKPILFNYSSFREIVNAVIVPVLGRCHLEWEATNWEATNWEWGVVTWAARFQSLRYDLGQPDIGLPFSTRQTCWLTLIKRKEETE